MTHWSPRASSTLSITAREGRRRPRTGSAQGSAESSVCTGSLFHCDAKKPLPARKIVEAPLERRRQLLQARHCRAKPPEQGATLHLSFHGGRERRKPALRGRLEADLGSAPGNGGRKQLGGQLTQRVFAETFAVQTRWR